LLNEAPEDLPTINDKAVIPEVVLANVHQPDEAALPAARDRKCACKPLAVELLVAQPATTFAVHLPPARTVQGRLDDPRSQMRIAKSLAIRADRVVSWHNSPRFEVVPHPIVPRVRNVFCPLAIS
jgi:hypothetical protein